jgi:hypothetical protein
MSILDEVLLEEYNRMKKMRVVIQNDIDSLPKGYLSIKVIKGKPHVYLQWRKGSKIVSRYIPVKQVAEIKKQIEKRNQHKQAIHEIDQNLKKIERVWQ